MVIVTAKYGTWRMELHGVDDDRIVMYLDRNAKFGKFLCHGVSAVAFFDLEALPLCFPEINERIGQCKYTKCTHRKEEGCAIVDAVKSGEIAKSRHESYVLLYDILKNKHKWDK